MKKLVLALLLVLVPLSAQGQGSYHLQLTPKVEQNLTILYSSLQTEIPLCLHGSVSGDTVTVDRTTFPDIEWSKANSTAYTATSCYGEADYVGMVHNHDYPYCFASQVDLFFFYRDLLAYVGVVACKRDNDVLFVPISK